jgi:carbonic anhydrase/acetyltransferase-like protein (isoleucine patch superfamily)
MEKEQLSSSSYWQPPNLDKAAFIAANATIIGNVTIAEGASVWYTAVLRGDVEAIGIPIFKTVLFYTAILENLQF